MDFKRIEDIRNDLHKAVNNSISDVYSIVHCELIRMATEKTELVVEFGGKEYIITATIIPKA